MKQTLLSIILVISSSQLFSQVSFKYDTLVFGNNCDEFEAVAYNPVTNGGTSTNLTWEKEVLNNSQNWDVAICDNNLCYDASVNTQNFDLAIDSTFDVFAVHVYFNGEKGESLTRVIIYSTESSFDRDTSYYSTNCWPSSVQSINDQIASIYPNPASESININPQSKKNFNISLKNNLGQVVYELNNAFGETEINLTNVASGTYYFLYQEEGSKTLFVKKVQIQ